MRIRCRPALVILALVFTMSTIAFAAPTLRIGTQPWLGYGPWWIAQEKGFFAARGVNVQLINFIQDQDVNAALASKAWTGPTSTHTALKFVDRADIRLVLLMDASYEAGATRRLCDQEHQDLRNKRVALRRLPPAIYC